MPVFSVQRDSISLAHLIDVISKGGEAPPLPQVTDDQVKIKTDVAGFAYQQLSTFKNYVEHQGKIFTGWADQDFYKLRTHDKVKTTTDQDTWDYTGDKVHVSVAWDEVGLAWSVVLPILIGNHHTIKDFKITRMELVRRALPDERASRIYYGAQITVYFRAAPGNEKAAIWDFAKVMKLVSAALKNAPIGAGYRPASDQAVDTYLSFRRDYDDLIDPQRFIARKRALGEKKTEDDAQEDLYISTNHYDYEKHRNLMKSRPLFGLLREN
jgi:Salmonella virulence-associated 28kDa protein